MCFLSDIADETVFFDNMRTSYTFVVGAQFVEMMKMSKGMMKRMECLEQVMQQKTTPLVGLKEEQTEISMIMMTLDGFSRLPPEVTRKILEYAIDSQLTRQMLSYVNRQFYSIMKTIPHVDVHLNDYVDLSITISVNKLQRMTGRNSALMVNLHENVLPADNWYRYWVVLDKVQRLNMKPGWYQVSWIFYRKKSM